MKALVLAAGFGKRLLPHTAHTPKPLFPIAGKPLLDIAIEKLKCAGVREIAVNTHHLHHKIEDFVSKRNYTLPIHVHYEPVILGTGGAIKNLSDFWDREPFFVVNSDIVTDIDFRSVYEFHLDHDCPATLVLHDDERFNHVTVADGGCIVDFHDRRMKGNPIPGRKLAFTGIQVLDPEILDFIPPGVFSSSSIDAFEKLLSDGGKIKAFIAAENSWKDVGTPERYAEAVMEAMAEQTFGQAWPDFDHCGIGFGKLAGDGSDRKWYRASSCGKSMIVADHGIGKMNEPSEAESFVCIGSHLREKGVPVPEIHAFDLFSGVVFVEDLGDENLQDFVRRSNTGEITAAYKSVIDSLIQMSVLGAEGFDLSKTWQTPRYDRELVLEKECRYFVDAFLNGYMGIRAGFGEFGEEFESIAEGATVSEFTGFMHRDMQSRNIMVKNGGFYFIDFQGGRSGPLQYDLASLLIDPYVSLSMDLQSELLGYCIGKLPNADIGRFERCYRYCAVARNLQILGAFGFLSRVKGKFWFEQYMPRAVDTLKRSLEEFDFPKLKSVLASIYDTERSV